MHVQENFQLSASRHQCLWFLYFLFKHVAHQFLDGGFFRDWSEVTEPPRYESQTPSSRVNMHQPSNLAQLPREDIVTLQHVIC